MSTFKTRPERRRTEETRATVDAMHTKKMSEFINKRESVNEQRLRLELLEEELSAITEPYQQMIKEDEIAALKEEIQRAESNNDMMQYFMETGDLLFQYHANQTSRPRQKAKKAAVIPGSRSVISFFTSTNSANDDTKTKPIEEPEAQILPLSKLSNEQVIDRFMMYVDPAYIPIPQKIENEIMSHCDRCGADLVVYPNEAKLVCTNADCAVEEYVLIECEKPSYKDPPREQSCFPYKRINHFNEWLAQFQAKESTDIPQEVYDLILIELRKSRIVNMTTLRVEKMREILKKLKLANYYEHIPYIIHRLNGVAAPVLSQETENRLRHMFREIQPSFIKHCPLERKNFLSYAYVLYKFCELLEMDEFLLCFPLLKSHEKLHEQDKIWRKICTDMHWEFIRCV